MSIVLGVACHNHIYHIALKSREVLYAIFKIGELGVHGINDDSFVHSENITELEQKLKFLKSSIMPLSFSKQVINVA